MIADFYLCPKCFFLEMGESLEEELESCPKCGSRLFQVHASGEAQHLIVDIWSDYGDEFASVAAIILSIFGYTPEYATLSVEVKDGIRTLGEEELLDILRGKKDIAERGAEILKELISPQEPIVEFLKRIVLE